MAFATLRQRLSNRPDSEHGQALVRLAVLSVVLLYLMVRGPDPDEPFSQYRDVLLMRSPQISLVAPMRRRTDQSIGA